MIATDKPSVYQFHGIALDPGRNGEALADCWDCGKERHRHINKENGKNHCKACGKKGNQYTFLQQLHGTRLATTTDRDYRQLAQTRDLPPTAVSRFKEAGFARDGDRWLIPTYNADGRLANLHSKNGQGPVMSSPGCSLHLFGGEKVADANADAPVYIVEGPWDMIAMQSLLLSQRKAGIVVAVPGAAVFKTEWAERFQDKDVVLLLDNDDAGRTGTAKVKKVLGSVAKSIRWIEWPKRKPAGFSGKRWGDGTDINDIAAAMKPAAAWKFLNAMLRPAPSAQSKGRAASATKPNRLICLADLEVKRVEWLWPNRIPLGKLSLIVGDPSQGKSLMTLDMAARITRGEPWPDMGRRKTKRGTVVLLSAEDDAADTVAPRLLAAGADLKRVSVLNILSLREDSGEVETAMSQPDCRAVIIDPISAYMPGVDSHRNADVRSVLAPLAELAARHRVAVIGVSHLNKCSGDAVMYRTTGSLAFVAAARSVWLVGPDKQDAERKLFLPLKANLARQQGGLAFRIAEMNNGAPRIEWERGSVSVDPQEVLAPDSFDSYGRTERDEAKDWLKDILLEGKVESKVVLQKGREAGHHQRTLMRAKSDLGVESTREGFGKGSVCYWELPEEGKPEEP